MRIRWNRQLATALNVVSIRFAFYLRYINDLSNELPSKFLYHPLYWFSLVPECLAVGAQAAGVKLISSEFGDNSEGATVSIRTKKDALRKRLKDDINLPYTAIYTGGFSDLVFQP